MTEKAVGELPRAFTSRTDLSVFATPRRLAQLPRHRWFYFPHSFHPTLVKAIFDECGIPEGGSVLDPFVGSGTTLLVAQECGLHSVGLDLSPVSVLASRAKTNLYDPEDLLRFLADVMAASAPPAPPVRGAPARLRRAFSAGELRNLMAIRQAIKMLPNPSREFFFLALLKTAREFSRAVPDGGWFRWAEKRARGGIVHAEFDRFAREMILDAKLNPKARQQPVQVIEGDARTIEVGRQYDAVVTSPPYPNRHDYTRVFHIQLLILGMSEPEILDLRHRTLRSHVEARANGHTVGGYTQPKALSKLLGDWPEDADRRIPPMLTGYFEDMHTSMARAGNALRSEGCAAFVVGNVRHAGRLIPVDEILAAIAPQVGLRHQRTWVIRERGNSAQQMGKLGRVPSRESVVFLKKP